MAFPIPAHLPRKKDSHDVSTNILTKVSEATARSLDAELASSWVAELDDTIAQTKQLIHERISSDLPGFERRLSSARSIQERLQALSNNVEALDESISNPESGLIPNVVNMLTSYASSSRETLDAGVCHDALAHLLKCRDAYWSTRDLVNSGRLPEAVVAANELNTAMSDAPEALSQTAVFQDLKRNFTAIKARAEEQLNDAYSRSIRVSSADLVVCPSIQVRQSETILSLSSVLGALSTDSLAAQLGSLRRDLTTFYVDYLMKQPASISITSSRDISGIQGHRLSLTPSPPSTCLTSRLENLASVLNFLGEHILSSLPESERTSFTVSLCKPIRNAVLNRLLIPALPSSMKSLPAFLDLTRRAVAFEQDHIVNSLGDCSNDNDIAAWVNNVGIHYERKRRTEILESARDIILQLEDEGKIFHAELTVHYEPEPSTPALPPQSAHEIDTTEEKPDGNDSAWDFEEEVPESGVPSEAAQLTGPSGSTSEENGWDFEDDLDTEPEAETSGPLPLRPQAPSAPSSEEDARNWNEDAPAAYDSVDDPWNDGWRDEDPKLSTLNGPAPKPAKGLELHGKKGRQNGHSSSLVDPLPLQYSPQGVMDVMPRLKENGAPALPIACEIYAVSDRTKGLVKLVENVVAEGDELLSSGILPPTSTTQHGNLILQAASLALGLYRALYPVAFSAELATSARRSARLSNDCLYLHEQLRRVSSGADIAIPSMKDRFSRDGDAMKVLSDSWFKNTIDRQTTDMNQILDRAAGFVETTDQDRFDECEGAVNEVLQRVRRFAHQLKNTLASSRYYVAIGAAVDAALSRMLTDILALADVTEAESHRLSELCRILTALEGLFVEDPAQPSFVVSYVPRWLKFSYLSELLEASIADISYLFEEGALVDFEIDELVNLVRALFADTPLRTNTINKLMQGHPHHT